MEAEVLELIAKLKKAEDNLNQKKKDDKYTSKRMDRDVKKIKDLSEELAKLQISKNRMETEFRAQAVNLNKAKTRETEANRKEDEIKKLRQTMKESEAQANLAKEQAEKLKKDLEASKDEIKAAKAQNDKLAKGLEQSSGRKVTAPASSDPNLTKLETSDAGHTHPNRADETNERDKQTIRDFTADNEDFLKRLKVANLLQFSGLKAATDPAEHEETSSEGEKQKIRDLTTNNGPLRKELEETKLIRHVRSIEADSLETATSSAKQHEKINSNNEEKQKTHILTTNNETLRKEINKLKKASHEIINPLTARNKALAKNCQDLKKKIVALADKGCRHQTRSWAGNSK